MINGLLTCIVLTYRNGEFLYETIDSILMQDYPHIELIVAEDGAPDFDAETLRKYIGQKKRESGECSYIFKFPQFGHSEKCK